MPPLETSPVLFCLVTYLTPLVGVVLPKVGVPYHWTINSDDKHNIDNPCNEASSHHWLFSHSLQHRYDSHHCTINPMIVIQANQTIMKSTNQHESPCANCTTNAPFTPLSHTHFCGNTGINIVRGCCWFGSRPNSVVAFGEYFLLGVYVNLVLNRLPYLSSPLTPKGTTHRTAYFR